MDTREPVTALAVAHAASRYMTTTNGIALMLSRLRADLVADDRDGVGVWAEGVAFLQQTLEDANQDMHELIHAWIESHLPVPLPTAAGEGGDA
jgi:O-succinylbenzoate synthase